ncbi:hypothetical protein [Terrarubrum flagellatum]|uniref:hypothetical protein n=1 Tax=Terrirubrum flagellatum TaxID=2895980 RepID=UPI0031452633
MNSPGMYRVFRSLMAFAALIGVTAEASAQGQGNVEVTLEAVAASSYRAPVAQVARNNLRVVLTVSPKRNLTYLTYWNGELQRNVEGQWRVGESATTSATRSVGSWKIRPNNQIEYDGRITTNLGSTIRLRYVIAIGGDSCSASMNAATASRDGLSRARQADGTEVVVDRRWYENISCRISAK